MKVNIKKGAWAKFGSSRNRLWALVVAAVALVAVGVWLVGKSGAVANLDLTVAQQDKSYVRAELKNRSDPPALHTTGSVEWRWVTISQGTCLTDDSIYSGRDVESNTNSRGFILVPVTTADVGKSICVKATSGADVYYGGTSDIDLSEPTIAEISQDGTTIKVKVEDHNITRDTNNTSNADDDKLWYKSDQSTCDSSVTGFSQTGITAPAAITFSGDKEVANFQFTSGADDGQWICVKFEDKFGNSAYKSYKYTTAGPEIISAIQIGNGDSAKLRIRAAEPAQWSPIATTDSIGESASSVSNCAEAGDDSFTSGASKLSYEWKFNASQENVHVCVYAKDSMTGNVTKVLFVGSVNWTSPIGFIQNNHRVFLIPSNKATTTYSNVPSTVKIFDAEKVANHNLRYILVEFDDNTSTTSPNADNCNASADNTSHFFGSNYSGHGGVKSVTRARSAVDGSITLSTAAGAVEYDAICAQIKDKYGNQQHGWTTIVDYQDSTSPYIEVTPRKAQYKSMVLEIMNTTGYSVDYWYRSAFTDTRPDACNAVTNAATLVSGSRNKNKIDLDVTASDVSKYACVRVQAHKTADGSVSNFYAIIHTGSSTADTSAPTITISQTDATVTAIASDGLGLGVDSDSWEYSVLDSTNKAAADGRCAAEPEPATPEIEWTKGSKASLSATDSNKYICFRVSDIVDNTAYKNLLVSRITDSTNPTLTVTVEGNSLKYSASDASGIDEKTYAHVAFDADTKEIVCMDKTLTWVDGQPTLTEADNGKHYCFRVSDNIGNTGYSDVVTISGIDMTGPVITVSQSADKVTAVSSEDGVTGWGYYKQAEDPACDGSSTTWANTKEVVIGKEVSNLTDEDVGDYLCFRAKDSADNYGYKKHQISQITAPDPDTTDDDDDDTDDTDDTYTPDTDDADGTDVVVSGMVQFSLGDDGMTVSVSLGDDKTVSATKYLYYSSEDVAKRQCTSSGEVTYHSAPGTRDTISLDFGETSRYYCYMVTDSDGMDHFGVYHAVGDTGTDPVTVPGDDQDPDGTSTDPTDPVTTTPIDPEDPTEPSDDGTTTDPGSTADPKDPATDEESNYWVLGIAIGGLVLVAIIFIAVGSKSGRRD